ncbi:MAG: cupredoxin domain-containing protein [Candidatus Aenigmarchaeota archaeon]|nr:cupredoxin domain-containing protein [Candidatus Aenigmarchaeota archaeon]
MDRKNMVAILGIVVIVSFFIVAASAIISAPKNTTELPIINQDKQPIKTSENGNITVKMSMTGNIYKFTPTSVNVGDEVTIVADMNTISGCYRSFLIPSLSLRKYLSNDDNKIVFTANKAGEFPVTCSMGMGTGKLIVR